MTSISYRYQNDHIYVWEVFSEFARSKYMEEMLNFAIASDDVLIIPD